MTIELKAEFTEDCGLFCKDTCKGFRFIGSLEDEMNSAFFTLINTYFLKNNKEAYFKDIKFLKIIQMLDIRCNITIEYKYVHKFFNLLNENEIYINEFLKINL